MKRLDLSKTSPEKIIAETCSVLADGGLVLFPTETVYGAGVDATNQAAVDKLLAYKSRREGKPLSIAVTDLAMAEQFVEVNDQARTLYEQFLPGPLTVVSKSLGVVANGVASEFGTLGVRIPDYPLLLDLVKAYRKPITATSANASGKKRPYSVDDVLSQLSAKQRSLIDLVLDAGKLPPNEPSTVIDTTLSTPVTVRQGSLQELAQKSDYSLLSDSEEETRSIAGRLLLQHWNDITKHGLIIGLNGPLGAGKTVFAQGAAEFLQIDEQLSSPTYTYMEEYDFVRHGFAGKLYHLDLWKIDSEKELQLLEIEKLLQPGSIWLIEWWSQVSQWLEPHLPEQFKLVEVTVEDLGSQRELHFGDTK